MIFKYNLQNLENDHVDILIPVYNAYEDLVQCINSVKNHTDLLKHHLWLLNDCSTDERIAPFLKGLEETHIHIINNSVNKGFVLNVNQGIYQSKNDIVLLNSDTKVTTGWIDKLIKCAYSNPLIATVTPLSNNATICSVPFGGQVNKIPDGYTVDKFAELIERCSNHYYPEIPTGNGFCIYIKRGIIKDIGVFDANTFNRGYGEENDFCYRAVTKGYYNVMCDDTFVYHKGTVSFMPEEKKANIEKHSKVLLERYREQVLKTEYYFMLNQNAEVYINIRMQLLLQSRFKGILLCYDEKYYQEKVFQIANVIKSINEFGLSVFMLFNRSGAYIMKGYNGLYQFEFNVDSLMKGNNQHKKAYCAAKILQCSCSRILSTLRMKKLLEGFLNAVGLTIDFLEDIENNENYIGQLSFLPKTNDELDFLSVIRCPKQDKDYLNLILQVEKNKNMAANNWNEVEKYKQVAIDNWNEVEKYKQMVEDNSLISEGHR